LTDTEPIARHAATLLSDAGPHGHKYAIDAMLSATALAAPGPVTILTSDLGLRTWSGRRESNPRYQPGNCRKLGS
jgi:hypothetical protein